MAKSEQEAKAMDDIKDNTGWKNKEQEGDRHSGHKGRRATTCVEPSYVSSSKKGRMQDRGPL